MSRSADFSFKPPYRIGVDIGGTFTDLVLVDSQGKLANEKVLTTPQDPSEGVLTGVDLILNNNGLKAVDVENVIHGTTLVANALIERKGVKTALVTTAGLRDVLEIAREWRYDIYDLFLTPVEPLVPRALRFEVTERVGFDGAIIQKVDTDEVRSVAQQIATTGAEAVAICFLHSFTNPDHEQQAKAILQSLLPDLTICVSSEVMPELGEYERTATAVCNAYVQPLFKKYIARLISGLQRMGIQKDLYLMQSDGGTVHFSTAMEHPIRLVQSGPAGGVQATSLIGKTAGLGDVMCFDMGGTTAKACLISDGASHVITDFEVARLQRFKKGSGIPLKVPAIDMIEIGSGGGSIARINQLGLIQVGPDSSSAVPGPACYGQGGMAPTVTDADLVLGYLDQDSFLGGDMKLDIVAAQQAIRSRIADPLSLSVIEAAFGIHETVNETMAQAAGIHALEKGLKASQFAMIPIGGAGPVHACHVAMKLGMQRVVIPRGAGVASAFGFLASPLSFQFVQALVTSLVDLNLSQIHTLIQALTAKGMAMLATSGLTAEQASVVVSVAMRYIGQGYEVQVPVSIDMNTSSVELLKAHLQKEFNRCYESLYGRTENTTATEVVSWRVVVQGPTPELIVLSVSRQVNDDQGSQLAMAALSGHRAVFSVLQKCFIDTPVFQRSKLRAGAFFSGPAVIEERESTVIVPAGATIRTDGYHNLCIELPLTL
jgi:N-methylhydantoinase A